LDDEEVEADHEEEERRRDIDSGKDVVIVSHWRAVFSYR